MPTEAREFLEFARKLREAEAPEISRRCAASRAYYGALHRVDETFAEFGPPVNGRKESSHDRIAGKALHHAKQGRPGRSDAATIASLLPQIKDLRNDADYHLHFDFTLLDLDRALRQANEVNRLCISVSHQIKTAAAKAESVAGPAAAVEQIPIASDPPGPNPSPSGGGRPVLKRVQ